VNLEREIKLEAPPTFRLPDLDVNGFHTGPRSEQRLVTTYLDTVDLRIVRWGASLRHRSGEGWTVKLPIGREGDLLERAEHVFPGENPAKPPAEALDLVAGFVRGARLRPVARLRTVRSATTVEDDDGQPLAVVTDDDVAVMDGRRIAFRFREVEVELAEGVGEEPAAELVERLRAAGARSGDATPKIRRALGDHVDLRPEIDVPELDERASVAELVRATIAGSVRRLIEHDPGVRLGDDPEAVHQARVATRRLRSDLRTFRELLDPEWTTALRDELKWLGGLLGEVRDADVLRARLRSREPRVGGNDRKVVERIAHVLDERRDEARGRLLAAMGARRYRDLLERLVHAADDPAVVGDAADARARDLAGALAERPWGHLEHAVGAAKAEETDTALHEARIRAKRVRYMAEAVAPLFGKRARTFASAAADLQDVLGEHQDAVVADAFLREAGARSIADAFVAGELAGFESEARRVVRETWRESWKALDRKRLRFWT
jgi:CHAD domain-containing protein